MTGKYVIIEQQGLECAVVFPSVVEHAAAVGRDVKVISAGFFSQSQNGAIIADGESKSLGIGSRPEDGPIIVQSLMLAGVKFFCPVPKF